MRPKSNTEDYINRLSKERPLFRCCGIYVNSATPIKHECKLHGIFYQSPNKMFTKSRAGCTECGRLLAGSKIIKSEQQVIDKIFDKHRDRVVLSEPYKGMRINHKFVCNNSHQWTAKPYNVVIGTACPKCNRIYNTKVRTSTHNKIVEKIKLLHNEKVILETKYINTSSLHVFKCDKGHTWKATVSSIIYNKSGCPKCCKTKMFSKDEKLWIKQMRKINPNILTSDDKYIKIQLGKKFLIPDGYDPTTKTVYEFHGDYWHGNLNKYKKKQYQIGMLCTEDLNRKTRKREKALLKAGYKVVYCWESDFKKYLKGKFIFRKLPFTKAVLSKSPYCY